MDGALLLQKVGFGYAKSAAVIGLAHNWYRGTLVGTIGPAYMQGTLNAAFAVDPHFAGVPNYASILWRAFVDTTQVQVGDALVGVQTWVMVRALDIAPPLALLCTDQISVTRNAAPTVGAGAIGYGGATSAATIATGLPANINLKKESGTPPGKLPGDAARLAYWMISFWAPNGTVRNHDVITDSNGIRYAVTAANWQPIGYQCLCEVLEA